MSKMTTRLTPCFKWAEGNITALLEYYHQITPPTMCSPNGNVIDKTEAIRSVFPTVMTGRPNGDECPSRSIRWTFYRFHNSVDRLAYRAQGSLDSIQRSRTHYQLDEPLKYCDGESNYSINRPEKARLEFLTAL